MKEELCCKDRVEGEEELYQFGGYLLIHNMLGENQDGTPCSYFGPPLLYCAWCGEKIKNPQKRNIRSGDMKIIEVEQKQPEIIILPRILDIFDPSENKKLTMLSIPPVASSPTEEERQAWAKLPPQKLNPWDGKEKI